MGDLSKNFSRWEFKCRGDKCCGHSAPVLPELVRELQNLRTAVDEPIYLTRGFSCNVHNTAVGGVPSGWHTLGGGADCLNPVFCNTEKLINLCGFSSKIGILILYDFHFHIDIRPRINGVLAVIDKRTS